MTKLDILKTLHTQQATLKQRFGVKKIGLFGSYAQEKQTEDSDLDFYVEFEQKSFDNLSGLWVYLENIFGKKVDIVYRPHRKDSTMLRRIENETVYG
jgi:predicted nucleotidyltransferase